MPIDVVCPQCQKTLRVGDHVAGKKIRCPACQAVVAVAEIVDIAPMEEPVRARPVKGPTDKSTQPKARPKRPSAPVDDETSWEDFDSYGSDALPQQTSRKPAKKNDIRESPTDKLIRKYSIESTCALAIAAAWCGILSVMVLVFL